MRLAARWLWLLLAAAPALAEPLELRIFDDQGKRLEPARTQASLSRTLPPELGAVPGPDHDALSFLLVTPPDASQEPLEILSLARGRPLDASVNFPTEPATCPDDVAPELVCRKSLPLRLVSTELDRVHPAVKRRSLVAALGGSVRLSLGGHALVELPVGAPSAAHARGASNFRSRLRVFVLRARRGGAPAVGGSDAGAKRALEHELAASAAIWAQCGVDLGVPSIEVVDPPSSQLLNVGCGVAQPASGGRLRLQAGSRTVTLDTRAGEAPVAVALRLADALASGGKSPPVFENQRAAGDAVSSADLVLRGAAEWHAAGAEPLSSDPSLRICLGRVDLNDGLAHFGDADAFSGTLEERALLRAFDDGDPRSIELFVVPSFDSVERIGESFIVSPGSSLSSAVIIDRSAIAAGARSFALAHELGHVLLAMPGHPDDFGVDQSWSLMDADVADPTIFGPRRLSSADCERALVQSGPNAITPLLDRVGKP